MDKSTSTNKKMNKNIKIAIIITGVIVILLLLFLGIREGINFQYRNQYKKQFKAEVAKYTSKYNIEEDLIYAIIKTKSDFNNNITFDDGSKGLMKISESNFIWVKDEISKKYPRDSFDISFENMLNPHFNIQYGGYLIYYYLQEFKDLETALVAYEVGLDQTKQWLNDSNLSKNCKLIISKLPNESTKNFVENVINTKKMYKKIY